MKKLKPYFNKTEDSPGPASAELENKDLDNNDNKTDQVNLENQDDNVSDYFVNLLNSTKEEQHNLSQKEVKPNIQQQKEVKKFNNNSFAYAEYGINSFEELEELKDSNINQYYAIQNEIILKQMKEFQQQTTEQFEHKLKVNSIISKAEADGYNSKDFLAYCNYLGCPVSDKSYDIYKKLNSKPNKKKFQELNNLANLQNNSNLDINSNKTSDNNNSISRAIDLAKMI